MTMGDEHPVLLCYDGSPSAASAIAEAAALFPGRRALVLSVWSSPIGMAVHGMATEAHEHREEQRRIASAHASEGCELARAAGLQADPITASGSREGTPQAILDAADEHDAGVIVVGARGLGGLQALFLGSVSEAVVRHARRPVLVVPTRKAAAG